MNAPTKLLRRVIATTLLSLALPMVAQAQRPAREAADAAGVVEVLRDLQAKHPVVRRVMAPDPSLAKRLDQSAAPQTAKEVKAQPAR